VSVLALEPVSVLERVPASALALELVLAPAQAPELVSVLAPARVLALASELEPARASVSALASELERAQAGDAISTTTSAPLLRHRRQLVPVWCRWGQAQSSRRTRAELSIQPPRWLR